MLNVVKGAFRFTTSKLGVNRRRAVDIKIGTFTAGIRGTDIWGRSNDERDLVCLIEGKIDVDSQGQKVSMSDPLSFFVKPKDAPADPISSLPKEQLDKWAMETELLNGDGIVNNEGRHFINIMSIKDQQVAVKIKALFDSDGFAADIEQAEINGTTWYRVRMNGLASRADADSLAATLKTEFELDNVWVGRT